MTKKKQSLETRIKSKRYILAALFSAIAGIELSNPGTLASLLGENAAAKLVGVAALLNILTKELDEKKKQQ